MMKSAKVERDSLWRRVHELLWEQIMEGRIAPGERLSDLRFAAEHGVSRGPVREALQRLEAEGLVTFSTGYGFRLREFTDADLDEIYELRGALEGLAARLVAGKLGAAQMKALESLVRRMGEQSKAGDWRAVLKTDMEFHETIVAAAGNSRLHAAWTQLRSQIVLIANATARSFGREITDIEQRHKVLLDSLRSRTPTAAAEVFEAHTADVHLAMQERRGAKAKSPTPAGARTREPSRVRA
jgi:GntR family transcriptional regulator of gluconate operon